MMWSWMMALRWQIQSSLEIKPLGCSLGAIPHSNFFTTFPNLAAGPSFTPCHFGGDMAHSFLDGGSVEGGHEKWELA